MVATGFFGDFRCVGLNGRFMAAMAVALAIPSEVSTDTDACGPCKDAAPDSAPDPVSPSAPAFDVARALQEVHGAMCLLAARRQMGSFMGGPAVAMLDASDFARLDALIARDCVDYEALVARAHGPLPTPPTTDRFEFLAMVVRRGLAAMEADHVNDLQLKDVVRICRGGTP